jgi:hypothetical protein
MDYTGYYVECRYAGCHVFMVMLSSHCSECHYAKCRYAECHGACKTVHHSAKELDIGPRVDSKKIFCSKNLLTFL